MAAQPGFNQPFKIRVFDPRHGVDLFLAKEQGERRICLLICVARPYSLTSGFRCTPSETPCQFTPKLQGHLISDCIAGGPFWMLIAGQWTHVGFVRYGFFRLSKYGRCVTRNITEQTDFDS
jgi:hypothetical protein